MIESVPPPHLQSTSMNQQHQPGGGMERVLFNVHHRICRFWMRRTSSQTRLLIEHLLLLSAILCFGLLVLLQKSFAFRQGTTNCASSCLLDYKNTSSDLIRLTITSPNHQRWPSTQNNSHHDRVMDEYTCHTSERSPTFEYSYSKTKAYLLLEPNDPLLKQLQVQNIQIDPYNLKCFGDGALQFLVWNLGFGWDTILINWLFVFNEPDETSYVYHPKTQRIVELTISSPQTSFLQKIWKTVWTKASVLVQTGFLFFFSTTLVSFTLNETQERMLEFTKELRRRVGQNLPLRSLISAHVLHSLVFCPLMVGKMVFLIEFYGGDKFLAFLTMFVVWAGEVFTVLSLRSWQGITYFPRIFFLLFCLYHIYWFANPLGFTVNAYLVVLLFIVHSMMFFWNRYELPAIAFGHITIYRPRAANATQQSQEIRPFLQTPPQVQRTTQLTRNEASSELENRNNEHFVSQQEVSETLSHSYPSFSTTSSSLSTGNSFLFHNSTENNNNDDDSFVYFMEGEIVLHRQEGHSRHYASPENQQTESTLHDAHIGLPMIDDSDNREGPSAGVPEEYSLEESSGLQAILDVRLTPRLRNTTSSRRSTPGATSVPPTFPELPPRRTKS